MDDETKEIISTIMNGAYNFRNFVSTLTDRVCEVASPEQTVFFAVHFAALLFDFECLDRISKFYGKLGIIRPNLFYGSAIQGRHEDIKKVRQTADELLSKNPPDWIALEMHVIKLEADTAEYPTEMPDPATMNAIEELLEKKPEFNFMRSRLDDSLTIRSLRDGDLERALGLNQKAIDNSEEYDDVNRLAHLLRTRGGILQSSNRTESQDLLLRSRELMSSMGDQSGLADVLFQLSKLESIQGYYDLAIEHNLECVRIRESIGTPVGMSALTLSTLFNVVGDSASGLEWAKMAETELAHRPMFQPRAVLNQAWSLTLLNKLDDAQQHIDSARESILKSGLESNLGWLYFINSVLESREDNYSNAASNVEESLDIYERSRGFVSFYICLHQRALIELLVERAEKTQSEGDTIGTWLTLLEEKSSSENLPGILGQALLLKARLFAQRGNRAKSIEVIEELNSLIHDSNLAFLEQAVDRLESTLQ
jgi:tetratricopeptide (TPR) repeat protein